MGLPGRCPDKTFGNKQGCGNSGGKCEHPNGRRDCTWHLEEAGEITLGELENTNEVKFCKANKREYRPETDSGDISFWNGKAHEGANARRVQTALNLFRKKYPHTPELEDLGCR